MPKWENDRAVIKAIGPSREATGGVGTHTHVACLGLGDEIGRVEGLGEAAAGVDVPEEDLG